MRFSESKTQKCQQQNMNSAGAYEIKPLGVMSEALS